VRGCRATGIPTATGPISNRLVRFRRTGQAVVAAPLHVSCGGRVKATSGANQGPAAGEDPPQTVKSSGRPSILALLQLRHRHVKRRRVHHAVALELDPHTIRPRPREDHVELFLSPSIAMKDDRDHIDQIVAGGQHVPPGAQILLQSIGGLQPERTSASSCPQSAAPAPSPARHPYWTRGSLPVPAASLDAASFTSSRSARVQSPSGPPVADCRLPDKKSASTRTLPGFGKLMS